MYYYILGCGIACLVLFGINSMDTVDVKPAEILGKVILWPVALMEAVVRYSSTHHNIKTAPYIPLRPAAAAVPTSRSRSRKRSWKPFCAQAPLPPAP